MNRFKSKGKTTRRRNKSGCKDHARNLLGCSQDDLSVFLGMSVSNLALCETGKREFSGTAKLKRQNLLKWISEAEMLMTDHPVLSLVQLKKYNLKFHSRLLRLQMQISEAKLKLTSMQIRCDMHTAAINRLQKMRSIEWGMALIPYPIWLNAVLAKNAIGLKKCDIEQQGILRIKIAAMEAECAVIEMLKSELDIRISAEFGTKGKAH